MAIIKIIDKKPLARLKVAAYCRVSTTNAEQLDSLENQKLHYEEYIKSNPDWEFVGIYSDDGISGRSANKRKSFQNLIQDALEGKIDFIITKSISRFARNTVDCLEAVRKLSEKKVYILFEQDNINTKNMDTELYLSIISALAENESRSTGENVRWGINKRFQEGTYKVGVPPYGYRNNNGVMEIVPHQAGVIKRIFSGVLSGEGAYTISKKLNEENIPSPKGKKWTSSSVLMIIQQQAYTGDMLFQQTYLDNDGVRRRNQGELDSYLYEEHHEAIISHEVFEQAQQVVKLHKEQNKVSKENCNKRYVFSGILYCGHCGGFVRHRVQHTNEEAYPLLACSVHIEDKNKCSMKSVRESVMKNTFCIMFNKLICGRRRILRVLLQELELKEKGFEKAGSIAILKEKITKLEEQREMLIAMQEKYGISVEVIQTEIMAINHQVEELSNQIMASWEPGYNINELRQLIKLCEDNNPITEFNEDLFKQIISKVGFYPGKKICFELKCGLKIFEREVR